MLIIESIDEHRSRVVILRDFNDNGGTLLTRKIVLADNIFTRRSYGLFGTRLLIVKCLKMIMSRDLEGHLSSVTGQKGAALIIKRG